MGTTPLNPGLINGVKLIERVRIANGPHPAFRARAEADHPLGGLSDAVPGLGATNIRDYVATRIYTPNGAVGCGADDSQDTGNLGPLRGGGIILINVAGIVQCPDILCTAGGN